MERFFAPHIQRFILRALFGVAVLLWASIGRLQAIGANSARLLVAVYLLYSLVVFTREKGWRGLRDELQLFVYIDIIFIGVLIALSGGPGSEFHLLLYFVVALRAPYRSWTQTLLVPGVSTIVYLVAVGHVGREYHWFELLVRVSLLWFLAVVLRVIGLKSVTERKRSEKLTRELSTTHDEVRRYTAELEKANAEKDKHLAEVTLLHRFITQVQVLDNYDEVYEAVMPHVRTICEPPWIFLLHQQSPGQPDLVIRTSGDPPDNVMDRIRERGIDPECRDDGARFKDDIESIGEVDFRYLSRCAKDKTSVSLVLCFPTGKWVLLEEQVRVLSALMDSVEMELELLRLRKDLSRANMHLEESNRHLMRIQELQHTLSTAFLTDEDISEVIHDAHEIMAKELFELDRLNLFLPDHEKAELQCRTSVGIGDYPLEEIIVPLDKRGGALSLSFREGKTIFFDGQGAVPDELRIAEPYNRIPAIRSRIFVIVPLIDHRGHVLGVIGADRKHTHKPIPAETVTMLEYFAHHVAMVLSVHQVKSEYSD
jgi:hypothetical protein